jgi:hypothetical protein
VNITFVQPQTFDGSQFPVAKQDRAFVSESGSTYAQGPQADGKRIVEFVLDASGNVVGAPTTLVEYVGTGRATVVGLAAGPDGLYFTELYRDEGAVTPIDAGARVLRVRFAPAGNGDFNGDAKVDAADYVVWRKTLGTTGVPAYSGADGDGDGAIDQGDLAVWKANFGDTLGVGSGATSGSSTSSIAAPPSSPAPGSTAALASLAAAEVPLLVSASRATMAKPHQDVSKQTFDTSLLARDRALAAFTSVETFSIERRSGRTSQRTHAALPPTSEVGGKVDLNTLLLLPTASSNDGEAGSDSNPLRAKQELHTDLAATIDEVWRARKNVPGTRPRRS